MKLELPPFYILHDCIAIYEIVVTSLFILRDCIAIYEIVVTSLFYFVRLHSNLINWSYFPFIFCVTALQSMKLELPPFYILPDCIAIYYLGVTSLLYVALCIAVYENGVASLFILCDCIAVYENGVASLFILCDCIAIY